MRSQCRARAIGEQRAFADQDRMRSNIRRNQENQASTITASRYRVTRPPFANPFPGFRQDVPRLRTWSFFPGYSCERVKSCQTMALDIGLDCLISAPVDGVCYCVLDGLHKPFRVPFEDVVDVWGTERLQKVMLCRPARHIRRIIIIPLQTKMSALHPFDHDREKTYARDRIDEWNTQT